LGARPLPDPGLSPPRDVVGWAVLIPGSVQIRTGGDGPKKTKSQVREPFDTCPKADLVRIQNRQ